MFLLQGANNHLLAFYKYPHIPQSDSNIYRRDYKHHSPDCPVWLHPCGEGFRQHIDVQIYQSGTVYAHREEGDHPLYDYQGPGLCKEHGYGSQDGKEDYEHVVPRPEVESFGPLEVGEEVVRLYSGIPICKLKPRIAQEDGSYYEEDGLADWSPGDLEEGLLNYSYLPALRHFAFGHKERPCEPAHKYRSYKV